MRWVLKPSQGIRPTWRALVDHPELAPEGVRADLHGLAGDLGDCIEQLTTFDYRNPEQLPDGGVPVVGASATGVQLAAEVRRSGRP